ncbi:hypothetical protein M407DRAFT_234029 [Tulasnella calospora MUT 4182]|uniref:F-box domain-containing protein n=1 Tax=Tulasnella calospora MUT 4182 TaxID=1051891 RepID=A0A0C3K3N9_9AGAM|nr:hypothetical protein M407DRAFT_234029 [Tulasnella calospora MUT 4182]
MRSAEAVSSLPQLQRRHVTHEESIPFGRFGRKTSQKFWCLEDTTGIGASGVDVDFIAHFPIECPRFVMHNLETTLHGLPTELLSHILLLTLSEDPWAWNIKDVRALASVCSSTCNLRVANLVLKRNVTGPLDVGLVQDIYPAPRRGEIWPEERHLSLARQHVSRWRHIKVSQHDLSSETVSIIESAESAESLSLCAWFQNPALLISICRLTRLQSLQLSQVFIDWTNVPRLPCLRVLEINLTPIPRIERLHALLGFAPGLESIEFRRLWSPSDSGHSVDKNGHQLSGLQPVSLTALTRLELDSVTSRWSAQVLTIIQPSRALSLFASYADSSVFHNPNFHQLATHALIGSGSVHVQVYQSTMHVKAREASTNSGVFTADFVMPELAGWKNVFQGLGAIVGSNSMFLVIGVLGEIDITDFVETLKNAPNVLPSIRTIQLLDARSFVILLDLLSREYLDDLGEVTWFASGLEELILAYSGDVDYENAFSALRKLWLERYAKLEINGEGPGSAGSLKGCSRLSRLSFRNINLVTRVKEEGLFPGTVVGTATF